MSSTLILKQRIEDIIAPWAQSEARPPFTGEQLVVMALLSEGVAMSEKEIFKRVVERFRYFQQQAIEALYEGTRHGFLFYDDLGDDDDDDDDAGVPERSIDIKGILSEVYRLYDVPLTRLANKTLKISAASGERVLRPLLEPEAEEEPFAFFKLPAELRNTIYELVFQYPKSGLHCELRIGYNHAPVVLPARCRDDATSDDWAKALSRSATLRTLPFTQILAPVLVSRQFRKEALPYFYNINTFRVDNLSSLGRLLAKIPTEHQKHIHSISLGYNIYESVDVPSVFRQLLALEGLRKLTVRIDEEAWKRLGVRYPQKKYQSATNMPGLSTLGRVRGLEEVVFEGCPSIESMLKENMLKPKPVKRGHGDGGGIAVGGGVGESRKKRKVAALADEKPTRKSGRAKKAKTG
ncbi:hypothetical protein LTR85_006824 [Meristemomyces frigidus]|nr:hypothetical protein LTR85_006824 [Meristemomyces frigidus]